MPMVIPSGTPHPFSWAEINSRLNSIATSEAQARRNANQGAMFSAEAGRQNALIEPQLAAQKAAAIAAAEAPYKMAEIAARRRGSGGGGGGNAVSGTGDGPFYFSADYAAATPHFYTEWEQTGAVNNRGQYAYRRRAPIAPAVNADGTVTRVPVGSLPPGAAAAANEIGGVTNVVAPPVAATPVPTAPTVPTTGGDAPLIFSRDADGKPVLRNPVTNAIEVHIPEEAMTDAGVK